MRKKNGAREKEKDNRGVAMSDRDRGAAGIFKVCADAFLSLALGTG